MSGAHLITLGCRLNIAESDGIAAMLHGRDDMVVVNSCAVTAEAVAEARKAIRRIARERPAARIVVTGCAATIEPATFAAMPEVAQVVANARKLDLSAYPTGPAAAFAPAPRPAHTRAFVEVQNGCDHRCTFCIIPAGRGDSRSIAVAAVIDRIAALVESGAREVVLTGVDVTSWGADLPGAPTLGHLVERILIDVPALPRLRLSSLDAVELDERLIELVTQEPRVMPHLHLSLQSGDDLILKRMKRRHGRAQVIGLVDRLKTARPEIAIGADLIAGFPTETEAMHRRSLALLAECDVVHAHIFPYSPRATTPAARMPQLDRATIVARARALRAAAAARKSAWLDDLAGTAQSVLIERDGFAGHAEGFARVRIATPATPGAIVPLVITGRDQETLIGIPA